VGNFHDREWGFPVLVDTSESGNARMGLRETMRLSKAIDPVALLSAEPLLGCP